MAKMNIKPQRNYNDTIKRLKRLEKDAENVVKRTVSDMKSRAPAWVSAAVVETYGIPKSEVRSAFDGAKNAPGRMRLAGTTIDNLQLQYSGRLLTPTHFKMKPTSPRRRAGRVVPYQISAEFFKGRRQPITRRAFLAPTGGAGKHIPFQRTGELRVMDRGRYEGELREAIQPIRTLSVPQMVQNEKVSTQALQNIEEGLSKRVEHHLGRALAKK